MSAIAQRRIKAMKNFQLKLAAMLYLALAGCSEPQIQKLAGNAQGTTYHISYWSSDPVKRDDIQTAVNQTFDDLDKVLSNYRPDSDIERFNAAKSTNVESVAPSIVELVEVARQVNRASEGCYDLTIKPLFELWGFQADKLHVPAQDELERQRARIGMDKLDVIDDHHLRKREPEIRVDVSSVAQGYSVEKISKVLENFGIRNYLVEIGGELKTDGHKPDGSVWRIAVEKPLPGEQKMMKVVNMPLDRPLAVMTSGTYRHYFDHEGQRYSHILDARDGKPVRHDLVAVTVMHENPTIADAWSTALLCVGQEQGMALANRNGLQAFFVQQQAQTLRETQSDALVSSGLKIE